MLSGLMIKDRIADVSACGLGRIEQVLIFRWHHICFDKSVNMLFSKQNLNFSVIKLNFLSPSFFFFYNQNGTFNLLILLLPKDVIYSFVHIYTVSYVEVFHFLLLHGLQSHMRRRTCIALRGLYTLNFDTFKWNDLLILCNELQKVLMIFKNYYRK